MRPQSAPLSGAVFRRQPVPGDGTLPLRLPCRYVLELLCDGRTPIRALSDTAIEENMSYLYGPGTIYELGAPSDYYKKTVPVDQLYIATDFSPNSPHHVDMTQMQFPDNSIDAFVSAFSLEHIREYRQAIAEVNRCLKPGGRLLLVVPFLYYYHAAPQDYIRFTCQYLEELLQGMVIHRLVPIGTRSLCVAEFFHEKPFARTPPSSYIARLAYRSLAIAFTIHYICFPRVDRTFASAFLVLAEKKMKEGGQ